MHPLIVVGVFGALYLQRFGFSNSGGSFISAGHVIVLLASLWLLAMRRAVVDLGNLLLLSAFVTYALCVTLYALTVPRDVTDVAPQSLFLVVTLYAVFCIAPRAMNHTGEVLRYFNRHMLVLGLLGIAQFAAQFAGLAFFTFDGFIPETLLIEHAYNVSIPLDWGSPWFKSNGVFFLEPSLFSQFSAVALAIEVFLFRRLGYIAVFAAAIVVSYSGSGPLILVATLAVISVLRPRYAIYLIGFLLGVAAFLFAASLVAPELYAYYAHRAFEIRSSGSSGYLRYVTPFILLDSAASGPELFFGYGPGAAEKFRLGVDYAVNALVKMVLDYGVLGAMLFFGFVLKAFSRNDAGMLLIVLCSCWYFLGGGYHLTSSVVHTMAAFLVWAAPARGTPADHASVRQHRQDVGGVDPGSPEAAGHGLEGALAVEKVRHERFFWSIIPPADRCECGVYRQEECKRWCLDQVLAFPPSGVPA